MSSVKNEYALDRATTLDKPEVYYRLSEISQTQKEKILHDYLYMEP